MMDSKYRHPVWLKGLWIALGIPFIVAAPFVKKSIWFPIMIFVFIALFGVTVLYNKIKTGVPPLVQCSVGLLVSSLTSNSSLFNTFNR